MAHLSKIFTRQPIDIPNRSGFDMSFENLLTMKCGTLTPVLCEECMPNETYNLGHVSQITLPPMATNFYGRIDLRFEAFFVPFRIIWQGWQNFWTFPENNPYGVPTIRPDGVPIFTSGTGQGSLNPSLFGPGTLADYLGFKTGRDSQLDNQCSGTLLPFLAYHKIYDDWYRNANIQKPVYVNNSNATSPLGRSPWYAESYNLTQLSQSSLADGVSVFDLRQRNWAKDYFTTAALFPQANGDVVGSTVEFDTSQATGQISIPALRSANVLQRWLDRNNIAGPRYADQIKAQYGIMPSDAIVDRALFLGSDVVGIYNRSVYQTSSSDAVADQSNPFNGQVGNIGASAQGFKDGSLIDSFKCTEHGYLIVLASIVPHAYYSTGTRRQLLHTKVGDFPIPLLEGLGEQPIYKNELVAATSAVGKVFGYQKQYAENKYHDDEVHGLLVDGESLESFCLQRSFMDDVELGTDFITIPENYLDQVTAVKSNVSKYGAWLDVYLSFKKVSPLAEYTIPTLGDLRNTHKETIPYRGRML